MAKKSIESLATEGNFSKSRISMFSFGAVSMAVLIWLIDLTVVVGGIEDKIQTQPTIPEKTAASPIEKYEWKIIASFFGTCSLDENNGIEYQNITTFKQCTELADKRNGTDSKNMMITK